MFTTENETYIILCWKLLIEYNNIKVEVKVSTETNKTYSTCACTNQRQNNASQKVIHTGNFRQVDCEGKIPFPVIA